MPLAGFCLSFRPKGEISRARANAPAVSPWLIVFAIVLLGAVIYVLSAVL